MIPTRTDHLSTIKTFPDLMRYLEHDMEESSRFPRLRRAYRVPKARSSDR